MQKAGEYTGDREGPVVVMRAYCTRCVHLKYTASPDCNEGLHVCQHPRAPHKRRWVEVYRKNDARGNFIATDLAYNKHATPGWCPLLDAAVAAKVASINEENGR